MSDFQEIHTHLRQAEDVLASIDGVMVEKTADATHDAVLPGAQSASTATLPDGMADLDPDYPGVRKVGYGRRVFHVVPPINHTEEWHLANGQDDILLSSGSDEGLMDALRDMVALTKPGQESKSALEGRSRPLTIDEAIEFLMFKALMDGPPEDVDQEVKDLGSLHPGARRLRRYWLRGEGALKILWGTPGDWTRCVAHLSKYMPGRAKGYCNLMHKRANGYYPGDKRNKHDDLEPEFKRDFDRDEREDAADEGQALPDGSFPIKSVQDLKNAIQAYGRAKSKSRAKRHIIKRARALNREDLLPDDWKNKDES